MAGRTRWWAASAGVILAAGGSWLALGPVGFAPAAAVGLAIAAALMDTVRRRRREAWLRRASWPEVDRMPAAVFGPWLAVLLTDMGFRVRRLPVVGPTARLMLVGRAGRILIQGHRGAPGRRIGAGAVQQARDARDRLGALHAAVVTNREFTRAARRLAQDTGISLLDRHALAAAMTQPPHPALRPAVGVAGPHPSAASRPRRGPQGEAEGMARPPAATEPTRSGPLPPTRRRRPPRNPAADSGPASSSAKR
jgi:restriction system protein